MAYFGGAGVKGHMHSSLRAYIDCFLSPPFPKMFPRGGGVWDQDPDLIKHFRIITKFHDDWKVSQQQIDNARANGPLGGSGGGGGPAGGLQSALDGYISQLEENGSY